MTIKVGTTFRIMWDIKVFCRFAGAFLQVILVLTFVLNPPSASAERVLDIENGPIDLQESQPLTKPFTILGQLLYSLERKVYEESEYIQPENSDFRLLRNRNVVTSVRYEKQNCRVGITFEVSVKGMDDPWEHVCERHTSRLALRLGILGAGSKSANEEANITRGILRRVFFHNHLGPVFADDDATKALQPFIDAVVVIGQFSVVTADEKSLAYSRWCALDIKTERMTYFEGKH